MKALRRPPPAEQNTYGLIFVKQNYESLKATTPRSKPLTVTSLCLRQWPRSKTVTTRNNDNQANGNLTKTSLHFCMISNRWLWLLEALSNCPLRSKRFRRRKMSILEKTKTTSFWWSNMRRNNTLKWHCIMKFPKRAFTCARLLWHTLHVQQCPSKQNRSGQQNKKGHLDGQDILTTLANKQTKDGHLLFQQIQLKVTTSRGAKHLRSQV